MKKLKAEYKGLIIMLGGLKIDTRSDLTATELELIERFKPNYVETSKASKRKSKSSTADSGDEPSEDGDTATESRPKEAEE